MNDQAVLGKVAAAAKAGNFSQALDLAIQALAADTGTLHLLGEDGALHLKAASDGIPGPVRAIIQTIPVGKGMAGLAVERGEPVTACNIQTDRSGDVRPGAKATGMEGAICVPILSGAKAVGALGVASRKEREFSREEQELLLAIGRTVAASAEMRA